MAFSGHNGDRVRLIFVSDANLTNAEGTVCSVRHKPWGHDVRTTVTVEIDGQKYECVCPPDYLEVVAVNNS